MEDLIQKISERNPQRITIPEAMMLLDKNEFNTRLICEMAVMAGVFEKFEENGDDVYKLKEVENG